MGDDAYTFQPRFRGLEYWKERLITFWPWELHVFFTNVLENEDPIVGELPFWAAVCYCYIQHGYYNRYLTDEGHKEALLAAGDVVKGVEAVFSHDTSGLEKFKKAFDTSVETGERFGWPTTTFYIMDTSDGLNDKMKARASTVDEPDCE